MSRQSQRGVVSVEAAFAFPALLIVVMIGFELANITLTLDMGEVALQRAVQSLRLEKELTDSVVEDTVREGIVNSSHGYIRKEHVMDVVIKKYASLDAFGNGKEEGEEDEDQSESNFSQTAPVWTVSVDVSKQYITPLVRLLAVYDNEFQHRFEQVVCYLPEEK